MRTILKEAWFAVALLALGPWACGDDGGGSGGGDTAAGVDTAPGADAAAQDTAVALDTTPPKQCGAPTGARPSARAEHAGIYDPVGDQLVFFGGSFGVPVNCSAIVAHTFEREHWIYDVGCDQWREISDGTTPVGRVRHAAAYDSQRRRMIIYGGRERKGGSGDYTLHPEVLAFDLATETWSEIATSGAAPAPRFNHSMVYDPDGDRLLIFGGNTSANPLVYTETNDVWQLELATGAWTELTPDVGAAFEPTARFWQSSLWDATRKWLVIFAGADNASAFNPTALYFNDVWALDLSGDTPTWYRLDTGVPSPMGRFWGGLVHDTVNDRYLAFGGHDDQGIGNRNDLWAFAPLAGSWQLVRAGDTANKPANGFCDFPPDFTNVDAAVPERRHAGVFVPGDGGAWLTGGKTDCGNVDDVFRYDYATDTWDEVVTATVGEVCLRKGGVNCNDMCF